MVAVYGRNSNRKSIAANENPDYFQSISGYGLKRLDGLVLRKRYSWSGKYGLLVTMGMRPNHRSVLGTA